MSSWSTSPSSPQRFGAPLIELDPGSDETLQRQIEAELRQAIRSGRLVPLSRLASTRTMAADLGVSRGTVAAAYDQLLAEGYLIARRGSGTVVSPTASSIAMSAVRATAAESLLKFDFRPSVPDLASFPRAAWMRSIRTALHALPDSELGYIDPAGTDALRNALARHLAVNRGVACVADDVMVVNGFAQGLSVFSHALSARGVTQVGMEDPGSFSSRDVIRTGGVEPVAIPVDGEGIDVDALARARLRAVLITPAHQYPLGVVLSPQRRQALIAWARNTDSLILEDDYDEQYRYDRKPVGALQALAPDRVVYAGSVSKTLAPALRLGWLVVGPDLRREMTVIRKHLDCSTPTLDQLALADLIERGDLDRHLRRTRKLYAQRRRALVDACARYLPEATLSGIAGGLHAVVSLPDGDEDEIVAAALRAGISLTGLRPFAIESTHPVSLVLGYGNLPAARIDSGIAALATVIARAPTVSVTDS
jgi:GntR family transcriptional regulator / MocR family aminotransferase